MFAKYLVATALIAFSLTGCIPTPIDCTDIAVSSTAITLENEAGDPVLGADVRFRTDELAEQPCDEFDGTYTCGFEIAGELIITIEADGFEPAEVTVEVGSDECHVITEELSVTLTTAAQPA